MDELERVFMHGETVGKMADIYGKGLDNAHTCADALSDDAAGGQRVDTVIHFKQVSCGLIRTMMIKQMGTHAQMRLNMMLVEDAWLTL